MTADNSNSATQQTQSGTGGSPPPVVYQIPKIKVELLRQ